MDIIKKDVLHLRKSGSLEQSRCIIEGCPCSQEPYRGRNNSGICDYFVLCAGHRKLAKDRYLGNVPENYVPSLNRHIYPNHPRCSVVGCDDYCTVDRVDRFTAERKFKRWCAFHVDPKNRDRLKTFSYANLSLPLPPLETDKTVSVHCEVSGCDRPARKLRRGGSYGRFCSHHASLRYRHLPMDYVPPKIVSSRLERKMCAVDGCDKLQANKGLVNGVPRYDLHCEKHRRGRFKVAVKPTVRLNKTKCSVCGWKGPCDSHRILRGKDGGRYTAGNVIVVCPNCHRLAHRGLLIL